MTSEDQTTRRQHLLRLGGVALTAIGGTTFASMSTSAEETESKGILTDGIELEGGDNWAFARGLGAFAMSMGGSTGAETLADRARNEFGNNTEHWINYANWLITEFDDVRPSGSVTVKLDVVKTNWVGDDERVETVIDATFDEEAYEYTDLEWRIDTADEPDFEAEIRNSAAENAPDELQEYRREFIDEDGDDHDLPDEAYVSRLAGKYMPAVVLGEDGQNVLELLVGDLNGDS
ncbi:hypothetical protein [Natronorubrum texcoconense]|uniref:Uncharacterized protein n=1 Tax=Natronorubrum texcoconense TaxID=1095776 RepID=A0A1G9H7J9_9EURY|nr:hypothetical protein [Natronorubrum texcoconense]SDL08910.1 hypothetical protein SAMN04515672_0135 [Natronorubrum texcoconense]